MTEHNIKNPSKPVRVIIISTGLGKINRGYESFTRECFDTLKDEEDLDMWLFKGSGERIGQEIPLKNLSRTGILASIVGSFFLRKDPYFAEQATFFLSLVPHLYRLRPNIIYFSDVQLGILLWKWRRITKAKYRLLFSNGAPITAHHLKRPFFDHIQQVAAPHVTVALAHGLPVEIQTLVPYGINIPDSANRVLPQERLRTRRGLSLPENRRIVLSVGALNIRHKRMDYVIQEIARMPEDERPFLVLLGQVEESTPEVLRIANELLHSDFAIRTVPHQEVAKYYEVADIFVLASLQEGLARVFLEAMSHGLPCCVHDYDLTRSVFRDDLACLADFTKPGGLSDLLQDNSGMIRQISPGSVRDYVDQRFSWKSLKPSYVELLLSVARGEH